MIWHGTELGDTCGDLLAAVRACTSKEEAREFMSALRAEDQYADPNVGYLLGYLDREERAKLEDWCSVSHPIFGCAQPTPKEAFRAGLRAAMH